MTKVSVVVPAYNAGKYLRQCVDSVLNQTHPDIECIVVNDGSTDFTKEILESYGDRIIAVHQPNKGRAAARNVGIEMATGNFVAMLDADDYWARDKIEKQLSLFQDKRDLGFVYSWAYLVTEDGTVLRELKGEEKPWPAAGQATFERLILRDDLPIAPMSTLLIRSQCIQDLGYFDCSINSAEEWDILLRGAYNWSVDYVPDYLAFYRAFGFHSPSKLAPRRRQDVHIEVIERAFTRLPRMNNELNDLRDLALARAYILGMHHAVAARNFAEAHRFLLNATTVYPSLFVGPNCYFVKKTAQFACELYDTVTPLDEALQFVKELFGNLPTSVENLSKLQSKVQGRVGAVAAFDGYRRGDFDAVKVGAMLAFRKDTQWLKNVGLWSIFIEAIGGTRVAGRIRKSYRFVKAS